MNEDWRNAFGILMCREICDGTGAWICNSVPSTCSSLNMAYKLLFLQNNAKYYSHVFSKNNCD